MDLRIVKRPAVEIEIVRLRASHGVDELEAGDSSNEEIEEWSEAWSPRRSGRGCDEIC